MSHRSWIAALLGGLFLAPLPAYAQKVKEHTSQNSRVAPDESSSRRSAKRDRVVKRIVQASNQFRRQRDRGELKVNRRLAQAAQYFAEYLARTGKFSHTADGKEPWERVSDYGYDYCLVAENIAYRFSSSDFSAKDLARGFMKSWKNSPGHRKNMLDPDVTEIGVGVARSKDGKYYAVQDFGRPKSAAIHFQITNRTDSAVDCTVDGKNYTVQPRYTITHQRCRPPRLTFQLPKGRQASSPKPEQTFHPRDGSHYVIRQNRSGEVTVEEAAQ